VSEPAPPSFYEKIGGEPAVRRLVDRFYELMDTLPEAAHIRQMHPPSLTESNLKLFEFLSGWLGGPPIYIQKRGHPRLRARHLPFPIDDAARDQWMLCMERALDEVVTDQEVGAKLKGGFRDLASHMRNRPG
jgi:hemoglobin